MDFLYDFIKIWASSAIKMKMYLYEKIAVECRYYKLVKLIRYYAIEIY